jgi:hypothetical protein
VGAGGGVGAARRRVEWTGDRNGYPRATLNVLMTPARAR